MGREIQDAKLISVKALPAAGADNTCDAIDLGPGAFKPEEMELRVTIPATPSLVEAKLITCTIVNGATSTPTTALVGLGFTVTGAAGAAGGPATTFTCRLPSATLRYVACKAAIPADGGTNTAISYTTKILL